MSPVWWKAEIYRFSTNRINLKKTEHPFLPSYPPMPSFSPAWTLNTSEFLTLVPGKEHINIRHLGDD